MESLKTQKSDTEAKTTQKQTPVKKSARKQRKRFITGKNDPLLEIVDVLTAIIQEVSDVSSVSDAIRQSLVSSRAMIFTEYVDKMNKEFNG